MVQYGHTQGRLLLDHTLCTWQAGRAMLVSAAETVKTSPSTHARAYCYSPAVLARPLQFYAPLEANPPC